MPRLLLAQPGPAVMQARQEQAHQDRHRLLALLEVLVVLEVLPMPADY